MFYHSTIPKTLLDVHAYAKLGSMFRWIMFGGMCKVSSRYLASSRLSGDPEGMMKSTMRPW